MRSTFFVFIVVWLIDDSLAQTPNAPVSNHASRVLTGSVTDRDGRPIEGVQVVPWNIDQEGKVHSTDDKGKFQMSAGVFVGDEPRVAFAYKEGFAVGALEFHTKTANVKLWPMEPVALRCLDEKGRPVSGAEVSIVDVAFGDIGLQTEVPKRLSPSFSVRSQDDGWATFRCTRPVDLVTVRVKGKDFGTQRFCTEAKRSLLSKSAPRFEVLQLCKSNRVSVRITRAGTPVKNWSVSGVATTSGVLAADKKRAAGTNGLLPLGIEFRDKTTDEDGMIEIDHAIIGHEFSITASDEKGRDRGTKNLVLRSDAMHATVDFDAISAEVGDEYAILVQDAESGDPVPNAKLQFYKNEINSPDDQQEASSDKNGIARVKLNPGKWWMASDPPDGYCHTGGYVPMIEVAKGSNTNLATCKFVKAKTVRGKVVGDQDLTNPETRVMAVGWITLADGKKVEGGGFFNYNEFGVFDIAIPQKAKIVSWGQELEILSSDPWVLKKID